MLLRRCFLDQTQLWRTYIKRDMLTSKIIARTPSDCPLVCRYHSFSLLRKNESSYASTSYIQPLHRKQYSKGLLHGDVSGMLNNAHEKDLKKILELFPQPRVTLNELTAKTPDKIFDIHFKQMSTAPKVAKKKVQNNSWVATYAFVWPEKMKFECTSQSKRLAAEKAATQALLWLYQNNRINDKGLPIYDKKVLEEIRSTLNEPLQATISDKTMERVERIWEDYQGGIKDIFEAAAKNAAHFEARAPVVLAKDSTIDEDDDLKMNDGLEDTDTSELKIRVHPVYGKQIKSPSASTLLRREQALKKAFVEYDEGLTALPIDEYRDEITSTIDKSRVTVIVGAAGCGKSTRVPAAILRHFGAKTAMVVSEPRRVAAIGLADRVASEMGEEVGDSIGFQVRLQAKPPRPPAGSVLYCTSGVLLRRLQANPGLEGCSHVVIDEAHERDVNTDITLLLLKRALNINPDLKVIIMSATLDTQVFTRYFSSCPVVEVPGRTFPVQISHLEDIQKKFGLSLKSSLENCVKVKGKLNVCCEEVAEVIKAVDKHNSEGAILVFLPGWADIKLTKRILDEHYGNSSLHMILPVHSKLSTTEQVKMFSRPPPGVRKIVLATNVAETSITIPDVVYVIDSGAHKENRINDLTGHCYRLYTKDKESEFAPHMLPEILRIPLEQTVLDCKAYAPDDKVQSFLSELPEPPSEKAIQFAVNDLIDLVLDCKAYAPEDKVQSFLSELPEPPSEKAIQFAVNDLIDLVLDCKAYVPDDRVQSFLSELPEPPGDKPIQFAVNDLIDLGALTQSEKLTKLGSILSTLSVHPRLARGVLTAAVVGGVTTAARVAAHCADYVELFHSAHERREEIREIKRSFSVTSDHCALGWIQDEFEIRSRDSSRQEVDDWCQKYGLRRDRLGYVRSLSNLYLEQLVKSGMLGPSPDAEELNRFSAIDELAAAILLSGSNSLLLTSRRVNTRRKLKTVVEVFTSKGDRAHIGSESVNHGLARRRSEPHLLVYFGGFHSTERRAFVVYKTTIVPPHTALLFSKGELNVSAVEDDGNTVLSLPRHRLKVHVPSSQADHFLKTKEMLWATLQYYIDRDARNLDYEETTRITRFKVRLFKAIGRMLVEANKEYNQNNIEGAVR